MIDTDDRQALAKLLILFVTSVTLFVGTAVALGLAWRVFQIVSGV